MASQQGFITHALVLLVLRHFFSFHFALHFDFSILHISFFYYYLASTSSIQASSSHGIMKHEPICVTYDH
jgi:hypothetical protein